MSKFHLDLKICEGCGALWLRSNPASIYCRRCTPLLADMPAARGLRPNSRPSRLDNRPHRLAVVPQSQPHIPGGTQ